MIRKHKTKDLYNKKAVAILTVKHIYSKEETQQFIKEFEEVTKKGSKVNTIMLNDEVIEFKGFIRKQPRIVNIPKACRALYKRLPQGIIKIKEVAPEGLEAFRKEWNEVVSGIDNSKRIYIENE